jgi:exopolysaccharide biosynthesis polyprenyl glycosylphosphotransferase
MLRRFSLDFAIFMMIVDAGSVAAALAVATYFRPMLSPLPLVANIPAPLEIPLLLFPVFSILWVAVLLLFSVYDARRNLRIGDELTSLTLGSLLAGIALAGVLYLSIRDVSRLLFITFFVLAYLLLVLYRVAFRLAFASGLLSAVQIRRVLVVGAGVVGMELVECIRRHRNLGLTLVGFLDDAPAKQSNPQVLGPLARARQIIKEQAIDDVIMALPRRAYERVNCLVTECHDLPVKIWIIPDYFALALHRATMEEFAGLPMLDLRAPALNEYQRMVKRGFDLMIVIVTLPLSLPLMGLIAFLVRLDSPGPVLFRQQRVGENGRAFEMLKFRTMVQNADELRHLVDRIDEEGHLIHKSRHDPRITRAGHFLRRASLDELPQIFNVLRGEMSLVGPRPELPFMVEQYQPWQRRRFAVPQGITGWWQVNGRSTKPMHLHTEDDLYYVQNYSLLLDLHILIKTVWAVLRGLGAY